MDQDDNGIQTQKNKKQEIRNRLKAHLQLSDQFNLSLKLQKIQSGECVLTNISQNQEIIQDKFQQNYLEFHQIGEGMHGIVKVCQNKFNGCEYVVKLIKSKDPEIIQAVFEEYQILQSLNHPSVVKAIDYFHNEKRGHIRLIMEYIQYPNLAEYLQKQKTIREEQIKNIFYKLLNAIKYIHQKQISHRDINPSNILIDIQNQDIKLIDFGIAKNFQQKLWTPTGTPSYKAPEILRSEPYTEQVDIWSAGVVLYQCLSGKLPFQSDKSLAKMQNGEFDIQTGIWQNISNEAKNLIYFMLKPIASERPTSHQVLSHPWFFNCKFQDIKQQVSNFDKIGLFQQKPLKLQISISNQESKNQENNLISPKEIKYQYSSGKKANNKFQSKFVNQENQQPSSETQPNKTRIFYFESPSILKKSKYTQKTFSDKRTICFKI